MRIHALIWVVVWLAAGSLFAGESGSSSYILKQDSVDGGGATSTSASYILDASAAQSRVIGTSSSPTFVLQSGFWSFVGAALVPVVLTVDRNVDDVSRIDLFWSGNNSPYEIYESGDCSDVFSSSLTTTPDNSLIAVAPPPIDLVCYSVLATAPGPAPPPLP